MTSLKSHAKIQGGKNGQQPGWYSLCLDEDFSLYYRSQQGVKWNLPLNGCHITFIAGDREKRVVTSEEMEPYMDETIDFEFDPIVMTNSESFWIECSSARLDSIRKELGLGNSFRGSYHITLGNTKNK